MKLNKKNWLLVFKILFPVSILFLIVIESENMVKSIDFNLLKSHFIELTPLKLIFIIIVGLVAMAPTLFYDVILCKILNLKIKVQKLFSLAWIINSFSNFLGFGGAIGLSLRTYFFKNYVKEKSLIIKNIAKVSVFYLSGTSIFCLITAVGMIKPTFLTNMKWLKIAVWFLAMYIPFILLSLKLKNRNNRRFSFRQSKIFSLIIVSIFEKIGSLLLIFVIARLLSIHIQLIQLFPIYSIATCAGFLSMLPGGIGSFDFILLMGFQYHHIPSETALLVLLLFRICYYFIPFIIGCGLFGTRILNQFIHYLVKGKNQKTEPQSVNS
ncbi:MULTISPECIES: lysylphosphatidylglycerol synthase domain-containing protein [Heyndrickxia]|uniref:lysylphosphatidylglycerol synthase domain-containing protein n=1 Tax=Heyndrickxia TaxID=2837504 RepID=UPI001B189FC1|nr:lysylphosphatidylglycerol synthase domain-containing protein [Heyndrickxia oleronia]GIN40480.1 hypothetical protein J19TS1_34290 [Heyndrickxia oleronia]